MTPVPTATPFPTETASPTPTREPLRLVVYQAYPGHEIRLPICPTDTGSELFQLTATNLPAGAVADSGTGMLIWTPSGDQLGGFYVPFACSDEGPPPWSIGGTLVFQVWPTDACATPACDTASGCDAELRLLEQPCCTGPSLPRISYAEAPCPEGAVLFVGRNRAGIGRLQNCDRLRVLNFLQAGAAVRLHVETRCLRTDRTVLVHARLETRNRLLFDEQQPVLLTLRPDGYAERLSATFPVAGPGPFFEFEGAEAMLRVTVTDAAGTMVSATRRVLLTFEPLDDLIDPPPPAQPGPG
jgi:hypothetical protein